MSEGGAGYMTNTGPVCNVRLVSFPLPGEQGANLPHVILLQAKQYIPANTELVQPYGIPGSASMGTTPSRWRWPHDGWCLHSLT